MTTFTESFEQAIAKAAGLPPEDQDFLAAVILAEIEDNRLWDGLFADTRSRALLERLAAEALAEDMAGLTEPLDDLLDDRPRRQPGQHRPRVAMSVPQRRRRISAWTPFRAAHHASTPQ